jgi:diguanylate cyclase (GGDEF)-like protein
MSNELDLSEVLTEFARTMVTDFPIQMILDRLVERIVEIMPVTAAGVTLISPGNDPRYVAASNDQALLFEQLQTELGEGPCMAAYETGRPISVPDLDVEERFPRFVPRALQEGMAAVFTFPLRHSDRRLGALDLYRDAPGELSPGIMADAQTLADVAAAYIINAQVRADLQDASERSKEAALHDALTGLPNRVLVLERLGHAFARARRSGKTLAVFFVDIDRFKVINDSHGHQIGDLVLIAVAERLTATLRPGDTLGRLSGDEFVIVCEDLNESSEADIIVARVDAALLPPVVVPGSELTLTASVGIAFAGRESGGPRQVLHDADIAMYQAKRRRQGTGRVLDLRDQHLSDNQGGLAEDLLGVSGRGELYLVYQPIVDTARGRMVGVEALLRWAHPSHGLVAPTVLVPIAEQSGLIPEIGQWVLHQAWAEQQRWQRQLGVDLAVSVNVSAHQLMSAGFVESVKAVLDTATTAPYLLTLELTESVLVRNAERALLVLRDLKRLGVTLALDDFGTGYSSLSYLKRFPVDVVKIDQTFVADIGRDLATDAIVDAVIQLAHILGMTVVAEGVETAEQHHTLADLGCDDCQGFYFARPMTSADLDDLIQHQWPETGVPPPRLAPR